MNIFSKLLATIGVVGALGLVGLGIAKAQTVASTPVDSAITTTSQAVTSPPTMKRGERHQAKLDAQAKVLGMTTAVLQQELTNGKPMYQIEAEHGVTYTKDRASRISQVKTRLDDMVKVGYMTQAEADATLQSAQNTPMMPGGFGGYRMMH